jgi:pimeloyl-ACP methyl ester carboxylesterase
VRLITYDRRSSGRSQYVLDEYSLPDLAADVRALLTYLGIERSVIIGDSMGGMIALQYALTYPQHVIALALLETGADIMSETIVGKNPQQLVERARMEGDRAVFESRKDELRHPPPLTDIGPRDPVWEEQMRAWHEAYLAALAATSDEDLFVYSTGTIRNYGASIGYDFTARLSELTIPVCIVHGDADTIVPLSYAHALRAGIPHAEFHAIAGATHCVLLFPGAVEALRDWLLRIAATTM